VVITTNFVVNVERSPIFYESTGPEHSKYVRHVGVGGCAEILGQGRKTGKTEKTVLKLIFFFSFDKFSLKLIENTTKMTLEYLDIAKLGFETKKKFEKNYDRVLNHCALQ
jgi:hypothetical protein